MAAGEVVGALCVERHDRAIGADELSSLEHLACLAAPVLNLMRLNQRGWVERCGDTAREAWARHAKPGLRRVFVGAALAAAAAFALWPIDWRVGGHARLEGAVQRVLVAPADGFLRQVHARPGQMVKAGQVLVELADQDLLLEQQRWQSALAQHDNAYAAANAHADRAQQVIHQSRAAEAQAQLDLVQLRLDRGRIDAPFDAVVVQGDLSQQLGAPLSQGAELMTLAPQGQFRVIVEIDERDIAAVAVGQAGTLALSALPWDTQPIRVTRITPMATALEGRNVFEVEAELKAPGAALRPGLQGSAHIVVGQRSGLASLSQRLVEGLRLALWEWWG
jgi:multidrug efflux pump subunit AcrA (membrane-fusion protein)